MNRFILMILNFGALLAFALQFGDLLAKQITGTAWWNLHLGADHLVNVLMVALVSVGAIILLVRSPFFSKETGLFAALLEPAMYVVFVSLLFDATFTLKSGHFNIALEEQLLPLTVVLFVVLKGKKALKRILVFIGLSETYLIFWYALFQFHITVTIAGIHTQYYGDMGTNLLEIGFWAFTALIYLVLLKLETKNHAK